MNSLKIVFLILISTNSFANQMPASERKAWEKQHAQSARITLSDSLRTRRAEVCERLPNMTSNLSFESVRNALNIPGTGNGCRFSRDEVRTLELSPIRPEHRGDYQCLALKDHMTKDSHSCSPNPDEVLFGPLPQVRGRVEGTQLYLNLFRAPYSYDVATNGNGGHFLVLRIAFKGAGTEVSGWRSTMEEKIAAAQNIWQDGTRQVRYMFRVVGRDELPHFTVDLLEEDTRGPYFFRWSLAWSENDVAHEIGHMLGLGDEYKEFGNDEHHCHYSSLMCVTSTKMAAVQPMHTYLVLRRLWCNVQP